MGLRDQATTVARDNAAAARTKREADWAATLERVENWFRKHFTVEALYVDTVTHADRLIRDRYSHHIVSVGNSTYQRWQVEDVVFLVEHTYKGVDKLYIEGTCKVCEQPTHVGYPIYTPLSNATDEKRREYLIDAIAGRLGRPTCPMCTENLPRNCPTCQRSN